MSKQEHIQVGCIPPAFLVPGGRGGSAQPPPVGRPPPPDAGHMTCDACWEANPHPQPLVNRMTRKCKNITFPQTLFCGR